MFRSKVIWSPIEIEYLKLHQLEPVDQLCIALAKTKAAIHRQLGVLQGKPVITSKMKNNRSKIGRREDLKMFFRSGWEANFARYLNASKKIWEYEPKTFVFEGVKHGTISYTPDFKVHSGGKYNWIEVKGYMKPADRTRLKRFKKQYPDEFAKLQVVISSRKTKLAKFFTELGLSESDIYEYLSIAKEAKKTIPEWE